VHTERNKTLGSVLRVTGQIALTLGRMSISITGMPAAVIAGGLCATMGAAAVVYVYFKHGRDSS
jgi:hypothetical protein